MDRKTSSQPVDEGKILTYEENHAPEVVTRYDDYPTPISSAYNGGEKSFYAPQYAQYSQHPSQQPTTPEKRICGLKRTTFFLAVTLAAVIIIAAVGGGVGGSMAVQRAKEQAEADSKATAVLQASNIPLPTSAITTSGSLTSTTTATSDSTTTAARGASISIPTSGLLTRDSLQINCPNLTGKTSAVSLGGKQTNFNTECNVDNTGDDVDILTLVAYTLDTCMLACASYNSKNSNASAKCIGVQFNGLLETMTSLYGGNCFLKKDTGKKETTTQTSSSTIKQYNMHLAAMLS
ncbi:hypothetical protein CkaCkLH20_03158 [Colletotrichum karsti]|uniref:Apple domain-containing protein n=1 Tax=Colletotrichum karsti TaxID=1095194 RepID=A0A9P6LNI8_9PEZI|nr:uncharacterized protein CkaCkLH20_03158 [Colletotrichum karsti]KAF9879615.1 hypothetical protein CkaCkLH20_03158 [Colletotrichum karsti]